MLDIVFVTYNSEKWLEGCVGSIANSEFDLKSVSLCFCDNGSTDGTLGLLEQIKMRYSSTFGGFEITKFESNRGFGAGCNAAAALSNRKVIFFLNIDTQVYPDTLASLANEINHDSDKTGVWELRQLPYEHPKNYNPVTGETSWCSGACFAIRRDLFEQIGGFDEHYYMYCEDVDLSWRVRAEGYLLRYIPSATVNHYCYKSAGEVKPTAYIYSRSNNLLLRLKFGGFPDVFAGYLYSLRDVLCRNPIVGRRQLLRAYVEGANGRREARKWRRENRHKLKGKTFQFLRLDYEIARDGAFYEGMRQPTDKKVSVIVRTCGRPDTLRETLLSLRRQTYPNIEIVIVEDGEDISRAMIENEFADLNIRYEATGTHVGRCAAGNRAMTIATGDYFNFLDDDDALYADHIETLVGALNRNPGAKVAHALAFETPILILSEQPYRYKIVRYTRALASAFNRLELLRRNLFPIQTVMFSRRLFEELGGMDETLDVLEDWDLWLRYAARHDFLPVEKTTSVYRVPAEPKVSELRQQELDRAFAIVRAKNAKNVCSWTYGNLLEDYLSGMALYGVKSSKMMRLARQIEKRLLPPMKRVRSVYRSVKCKLLRFQ